ncbi:Ku protein [Amycolatopsis anabasis]|uniref:non-homologous end joining protein Ku n=1 Tax=Amycolatopsis anabasis TaxID=1840409 RepID=UPI00131D6F96|nr:Ku protein [Amycolatopsis anabasis]
MRAIWKGTIGFGSAAIPVKVYSATEEQTTGLHQLHVTDGGRIRNKRICEVDGAEVDAAELGKGFQVPGSDVVVLTEEELASLPLPTAHSIEICAFTPLDQIDPIYFARTYYLEPEAAGTRPYVLLSEALQQSGRVAVVKVALRQREALGILRVRDQVIMLETMLWPDEVRRPDFPFQHEDVDVRVSDIRAAVAMIERLARDFDPERYADRYQEALEALITAKVEGGEVVQPTAAVQEAGVTELLSALQNSAADVVEADQERAASVGKAKAAARKAKASKEAAKKAAGKARGAAKSRR